ncbi:MAG: alpha/beta fold hydrolase [Lautropia sp.]
MPFLERPGKPTLHYCIDDFTDPWKNRPYLLLQHGYSRSGKFWYNWVPYLSRFFKVVRPDLRGLGQSPLDFDPKQGYTVDGFLEDLVDLLDHIGIDKVHYCGESLGGMIGMGFAARHPDRVKTLTCVASGVWHNKFVTDTFSFGHPSWQEALRKMGARGWSAAANSGMRFPPGTEQGLLDFYADEIGKSPLEAMIALSELAEVVDLSDALPGIKAPVLGIYPAGAKVADDEQMKRLQTQVADFTLVRMKNSTHTIMSLEGAACAKTLLAFAATHEGFSFVE